MSLAQNLKLSLPKNRKSEEAVLLTVCSTHEYNKLREGQPSHDVPRTVNIGNSKDGQWDSPGSYKPTKHIIYRCVISRQQCIL